VPKQTVDCTQTSVLFIHIPCSYIIAGQKNEVHLTLHLYLKNNKPQLVICLNTPNSQINRFASSKKKCSIFLVALLKYQKTQSMTA